MSETRGWRTTAWLRSLTARLVLLELAAVTAWAVIWLAADTVTPRLAALPWLAALVVVLSAGSAFVLRRHRRALRDAAAAARAFADGRTDSFDGAASSSDTEVAALQRALAVLALAVTEREQILRSDMLQLQEVETMKKEFVSTVSHELRTPLTAMRGALGLVLAGAAGPVAPRSRELLEIARQNTERLIRLINDILDVERLEGGHLEVNHQPCDLRSVLATTLEGMRTVASEVDVRLELTGPPQAIVSGDADRLVQVFTNLLSNAVKYSPRGGVVTVTLETTDALARVAVHDDGPGIPPAFQSRIFGKFQQAEPQGTTGGTGLGLAIARAIVDRHGGSIGFTSAATGGTTFTVELPYTPPAASASAAQNGRHRILVLDRDPHMVRLLRTLCEPFGDTVGVGSGEAAWSALTAGGPPIDALVLDLESPESSHAALVRRARSLSSYAELPVLVFSAREFSVAELEGITLAPSHAFVKTRDREQDVLRRLKAVLAVRRPR